MAGKMAGHTAAVLLLGCLCCGSCSEKPVARPAIIPLPQEIVWNEGAWTLPEAVTVAYDREELRPAAEYICEALGTSVRATATAGAAGDIVLDVSWRGKADGYRLGITPRGVVIGGDSYRGVVNGIATLRQLLSSVPVPGSRVPAVEIEDAPHFVWRGAMLDVARHFFTPDEVKRFIDQMAQLKLNKFHWHLTDDQGWRVEIRRYPRLTEVGAWRQYNKQDSICIRRQREECNDDFALPADRLRAEGTDTLYGGFYTQDEIRDVVAYAARRGIDVIPEIDMPGHFLKGIEAYPELTCSGRSVWDGGFSAPLCLGRDETLAFCDGIWEEIFELFPYVYVHLGGDEVPRENWCKCARCQERIRREGLGSEEELQAWFMHRMERFVNDHGKRMIGWDEITEGGLSPTATVMWWRTWEPGTVSAVTRRGNPVIVCPQVYFYYSLEEDRASQSRIYDFDVEPDSLSTAQKALIRGVQANIWTERVPTMSRLEYLLYPRLLIAAEKAWRGDAGRDAQSFRDRLLNYCARLDDAGVNFRIPSLRGYCDYNVFLDKTLTSLSSPYAGAELHYTLDGSVPVAESLRYDGPLEITGDCTLKVRAFHRDGRAGDYATIRYLRTDYAEPYAGEVPGQPGLHARWYDKRVASCDEVGAGRPDGECVLPDVGIPGAAQGKRAVGIVLDGYIDIPETGIYTFALTSDDGSVLCIGNRVVVDNDGVHAPLRKTGQAALKKGLHPVEVRYFDHNGGVLSLEVLDRNGTYVPPVNWFRH